LNFTLVDGTKEALKNDIGDLTRQKTRFQLQHMESLIIPGLFVIKLSFESKKDNSIRIKIEKDSGDREGWEVVRREVDFVNLHRKLKDMYPKIMQDMELPKTANIFHRSKEVDASKRDALEKYLQVFIEFLIRLAISR
jgi:hypothetical protein